MSYLSDPKHFTVPGAGSLLAGCYTHPDDYDMQGAEWLDVSMIGMPFHLEINMNRADSYRHRRIGTLDPWAAGWPEEKEETNVPSV